MAKEPARGTVRTQHPLSLAHRTPKPPPECRFYELPKGEFEDCFCYEIQRYRLPQIRAKIQNELASIPVDAAMPLEPEEVEGSPFGRRLELQRQFLELMEYEKPWLERSGTDLPPFLRQHKRRRPQSKREPVQLASRIDPLTRARLLIQDPQIEELSIVIDWAASPTPLTNSFKRLIQKLSTEWRKTKYKKERRGRPRSSIEHNLFALAAWRCSKLNMTHDQIWSVLGRLRQKWHIYPDRRKIGSFVRSIDQMISQEF